ncbi:MAG: flagellar basal body rod protein FlgC [Candidatus Eisenbacteria bacterium]|uniref:Flagellar basal-body rod protein FlgC n=1 Tax=Eiseniibacteriota bacterium TaxID=2212470 RepID=A0A7Y2EAB2_UNCEI|nr:flagellar basal body rod protein FlgC [Candidatus Eisenbacteria bacterium]
MPSLAISAKGMSVQQGFLETIASNIANAETTRMPDGGPYKRQVATSQIGANGELNTTVTEDAAPGRMVYEPSHPDADENGFVEYPNVEVQSELVDLMVVRRLYEANATVFQAAKMMLKSALEI